jgi:methylase of polypeptide subunit release factors
MLLDPPATDRLRDAFLAAGYDIEAALAALGEAGRADLARNHTAAAERALGRRDDALATLIRLFVLQLAQPQAAVARALPVADLLAAGILGPAPGDAYRAHLDIRPYGGDDGTAGWLVSDHQATLNTARGRPRPDHVLGLSPASVTLAQLTPRDPVGAALDLGTGCGVQALHLARHADRVTATDVTRRALDCAELTCRLSGVSAEFVEGSLYEPLAGRRFDLIAANPPFVIAPPARHHLAYREAGAASDDLMRAVVAGAAGQLADGGRLVVLGNWAHLRGQPWQDRVTAWLPAGADALVLQREVLDPAEYAEIWLADAGLAGTAAYRRELDRWLAYFDHLQLEAVGLGWIVAQANGRADPSVQAFDWPHPVAQPVAAELAARLGAVDASRAPDAAMLATCWRLAPDIYQEQVGQPGAADPAHITFRRTTGLCAAEPVSSDLAALLGASDGDLPLGDLIAAVARLTGQDAAGLTAALLPAVRRLVRDTWLIPPDMRPA